MTTYCIDENKNLVNTLAITKREFTSNIQITSPVEANDAWNFLSEYKEEFLSFINAHTNDILAINLSGTILHDTSITMYPAFIIYTSTTSTYASIGANIIINGCKGRILFTMNDSFSLVNINLDMSTTPKWVQGETYTLVTTFYVTS